MMQLPVVRVPKALRTRGQFRERIKALEKTIRELRRDNETLKYALAENTVIAGDLITFLKMKSWNPLKRFTGWLIRLQMRKDESFLGNNDTKRLRS